MKLRKKLPVIAMLWIALIAGCAKDKYAPIVGLCPKVESTIPADQAVGVPLDQVVSATFNEKMDPSTINNSSIILTASVTIVGTKAAIVSIEGVVTYNDKTATFTPKDPLSPNITYTGRVTTAAKDPMGNALQADYVWTFTTGIAPTVISTDPANNAVGVLLNKAVAATFSVPMDPLTITGTTFTLNQGPTAIAGTVTYTASTATFTPTSALAPNTVYTGTITTGAKNVAGIAMENNYVWNFNTGVSPIVISTDPINLATGVVLNKVVAATFSVPMDPLTMTGTTFTLKQGVNPIAGAVTYSGTSAYFTPTVPLLPGTLYAATITTGAKSLVGIPLAADYAWTFTTGVSPTVISTDPANLATGVILNKIVSATFSLPMDYLTLSATTFTLKQGVNPIAGAVTYSGTTAFFTPTSALTPNLVYTGTITTGAKSLGGIPLAANYEWRFTTASAVAPTVTATDPANHATGVVLNKIVTATFSLPMDPLTIIGTTFTLKQGVNPIAGAVTYSGTMASFTPTVPLLPGILYTATITTGAKSLTGVPMAANYVWTFTTGVAPTVLTTDPANLAKGVVLNKIVTATFSLPMDPLTINGTTFTLEQGTNTLLGTVSYNGAKASFTPSVNLLAGMVYKATIKTGAKSLGGIPLTANYVWTFTTVAPVVPIVILTDPSNGTTGVDPNKTVSATFNMPMDRTTLVSPATTFTLKQGTTSVPGTVSYSSATANFTPSSSLLLGTTYTATVTAGAKNVAGTPMARDTVWSFTTRAAVKTLYSSIFGSFGGNAGITNQGIHTVINNGSIGTTAASTLITGFHDSTGDKYTETTLNIGNVTGRIYTAPPPPVIPPVGATGGTAETMKIAQDGLLAASNFYISISPANKPGGIDVGNGELGNRTLTPGVYKSAPGTYNISAGDLTLDAQGDPNAVWIFQAPSALTVGVSGPTGAKSVKLINGAQAKNVYWYVGSQAVINYAGGGTMVGTIIANSGVTLSSPGNSTNTTVQTVLNGRAISLVSSVTMVNTIINVPNP